MTIRNDATRLRIITKDARRPRAVVARQGQVLLDADFDQQSRLHLERIETETVDILGAPGRLAVPEGNAGFKVTTSGAPADFDIAAGRGYLDGWLLENAATCRLATQPHPRSGDTVAAPAIIALKALIRHVDPAEDPVLADPALGDAQASGRSLVDWQVFPFAVSGGGTVTCATAPSNPDWQKMIAPSTGALAATVQTTAPSNDPCSLTPGGGYTRLENLLYRIEVHGGDVAASFPTVDGPRFGLNNLKLKLSRRNASTMVRITAVAGTAIMVTPPMLDARNWFAPGLFAEIVSTHDDVDPRAAVANERLFRVALATDDQITLEGTATDVTATRVLGAGTGDWFLRLWDAFPDDKGVAVVSAAGNATDSADIDLGDGITIKLSGGSSATFRRGDFWTWAARADGTVDWPTAGGAAQLMTPHGPVVRYAPIAALVGTQTSPTFEDCRIPFATLTDRALLYRGGDGQSVFAPAGSNLVTLPSKLRVAVMRGESPVVGATVRWSLFPGAAPCQINGTACNAANPFVMLTGADGLAEVNWAIDASKPLDLHRVQASIDPGQTASGPAPIVFSATFETAAHTGYTPGKCNHLMQVDNVQDALDVLCSKIVTPRSLILNSIVLLGSTAKVELIKEDLILNALVVPYDAIRGGIAFGMDGGKPGMEIQPFDPVVEVELDLPYPTTDPDKIYWARASQVVPTPPTTPIPGVDGPFGFHRVRLDGAVAVAEKGLTWTPSARAARFFETVPQHQWGQKINPESAEQLKGLRWQPGSINDVLCRIRLRSAMIWIEDANEERIYLNAEHLGVKGSATKRELLVKDRDPQRAADLDMFVYLRFSPPTAAAAATFDRARGRSRVKARSRLKKPSA